MAKVRKFSLNFQLKKIVSLHPQIFGEVAQLVRASDS